MKFILLESRGGNYLVVAENIAWLRTGENGQTNVGMVGGAPLLVVGSIEEVAAKILAATKEDEQPVAQAPAATPAVPAAPAPAPTPAPEPAPAEPLAEVPAAALPDEEPAVEEEAPAQAAVAQKPTPATAPERRAAPAARPSTLADRLARTAGPTVKAGKQRFMSMSDMG